MEEVSRVLKLYTVLEPEQTVSVSCYCEERRASLLSQFGCYMCELETFGLRTGGSSGHQTTLGCRALLAELAEQGKSSLLHNENKH